MEIQKTIEFEKLITKCNGVKREYLKKFGENSLDFVFLFDPLGIEQHPEELIEAISELQKAIDKNDPFPNEEPDGEIIY